jgi:hypothetical protein
MVASLTETALASACPPMEAMGTAAMPEMAGMDATGGSPCDDCGPTGDREQSNQSDAPPCPFSPAGAGFGCSPLAVQPSACAAGMTMPTAYSVPLNSSDVGHPLLWVAAVFRPPRL